MTDSCSKCLKQVPSDELAPICCKQHELCIDCYCQLQDENYSNLSCYCCYRFPFYNVDVDHQTSFALEVDNIVLEKEEYLEVLTFDYLYVSEHLLDDDLQLIEEDVPMHTPIYKYTIPICFQNTDGPMDSKQKYAANRVKYGIISCISTYLNCFRAHKQVKTEVLIELITKSHGFIDNFINRGWKDIESVYSFSQQQGKVFVAVTFQED